MCPMANPKACDCGRIATSGQQCDTCRASSKARHSQLSTHRAKRYGHDWDKLVALLIKSGNIMCQHVDRYTRYRCQAEARISHHLMNAAAYPQFLLKQSNVVRVCREHHPNSPGDDGTALYIPTTWPLSLGGAPAVDIEPGTRVPDNVQLWSLASQTKILLGR